jgi:hypothetical protein
MAAAAAVCLLWVSPVSGAREASPPQQPVDLDKARAAKKQAEAEKARVYLEAHLFYRKCEREFRPFCLRSAQMMMRNADARYKYRESREFPNIATIEATIKADKAARDGFQNCGTSSCAKAGE